MHLLVLVENTNIDREIVDLLNQNVIPSVIEKSNTKILRLLPE